MKETSMSSDRKVAVITGASQGIGAALVEAYRDRLAADKLSPSSLVSRFRSSPEFAARSEASFGIEGHWQIYDSSAALNPKFAIGLAAIVVRTSGSRH